MNNRQTLIKIDGLSLLRPTKTRNYWRIKGVLPDGRPIDTTGGKTRAMAEAKARSAVVEAREPTSPGAVQHKAVLYRTVLDEFVNPDNHDRWGKNGGRRHADDTKGALWNHVRPVLGNRTCESLRPSDFRAILQSMRREGYAGGTIQRVGSSMRATVTYMMNERYIEQGYDPMLGVSYSSASLQDPWVPYEDRPTIEHKDALADAMAVFAGRRWWLATQLAALAGPRWGELIYLTPSHFSVQDCEIKIEFQWNEHGTKQPNGVTATGQPVGHFVRARPKNGRERVITYPQWMNEHFEELFEQVAKDHTDRFAYSGRSKNPLKLLFCTETGTIPRRSTWNRQVITPARELANWPYEEGPATRIVKGKPKEIQVRQYQWSWHSLRHLFCALTISKDEYGYGLDAAEGARLAGHTLEVFMQKYVQPPAGFTKRTAKIMALQAPPRSA